MKNLLALIVGLTCLTITAQAQKIALTKVPAEVKSSFAKAHPTSKAITWEKEKMDYEAGFTWKGQGISEVYTAKGVLVESETEIEVSMLPPAAIAYVAAHNKGAKIKEAAKITKTTGEITYEAEVNGKDLIFDTKGNPVE
jgi:hypothetical protein